MSRDACFVAFENAQTRVLADQGWRLTILDMQTRYLVSGRRSIPNGRGTYGTTVDGDTPAEAVAAFAQRIIDLKLQDNPFA